MEKISVIGSAGTGKTKWIEEDIQKNDNKYTYLTYNVSMAGEARKRLGTGKDTTGTIHSMVSRKLGIFDFLSKDDIHNWAKHEGLSLTRGNNIFEESGLEKFQRYYDFFANTMVKPYQPKHETMNILSLYDSYEKYKRMLKKNDYTDILTQGAEERYYTETLYVDECQDLTPVMWKIIDNWDCDRRVIVGDDEQAINSFRGVDIEDFFRRVQNPVILDKSWRFGDNIRMLSDRIIGTARRIERNYRGMGETEIARLSIKNFANLPGSKAILCRSNSMAVKLARELPYAIIPIKAEISYGNGWTHRAFKITDIMRKYPNMDAGDFTYIVKHSPATLWVRGTKSKVLHEPTIFSYDLLKEKMKNVDIVNKMDIKTQERQNIVKMLTETVPIIYVDTMHSSKGLEYDNVMVATDKPATFDFDDDERRLLSVAVTRVKNILSFHYFGYYTEEYDVLKHA